MQVRVKAVFAIGDFKSADRALDAKRFTELLTCSASGGSSPGVADLFQEYRQIVSQSMRDRERQELDLHPHGLCQSHGSNQLSSTPFADLCSTDRAGPNRGADLEARVERFPVLGAAVHLEGLLRDSPAAALGCAGSGQQTVDHAFQSEPFPPEVARVDVLDVLAAFRINLEAGYLTGFVVDDLMSGLSFRVYTKGRYSPRIWGTI